MGLKSIMGIRQFTAFTKAGKVQIRYEVTFTTMKTDGEFTFEIPADEYNADKAMTEAKTRAEQIDAAIK